MNYKNTFLSTRIVLAFVTLLSIIIISGAITIWGAGAIREKTMDLARKEVPQLILIADVMQEIGTVQISLLRLLDTEIASEKENYEKQIDRLSSMAERSSTDHRDNGKRASGRHRTMP